MNDPDRFVRMLNAIGKYTAGNEGHSPEYVRLSPIAAEVCGLTPDNSGAAARSGCLNLILAYPERCLASCSYCGLGHGGDGADGPAQERGRLPVYPLPQIIAASRKQKGLARLCISMVTHPRAVDDTLTLVEQLTAEPGLPVSLLLNPTVMDSGDLELLRDAGADHVAVAVAAAAPQLFDRDRGAGVGGPHRWQRYWLELERAASTFGRGRFSCHLIAGLGETERQMMETVQRVHELGGVSCLHPFHPHDSNSCPAGQFRRVQLGRFLINYGLASWNRMEFDEDDRITGFGLAGLPLDELVGSGRPFMACACPGMEGKCICGLSFGGAINGLSNPLVIDTGDIQSIRKQLATYLAVREPWSPALNR